jgi:hypothetical protein
MKNELKTIFDCTRRVKVMVCVCLYGNIRGIFGPIIMKSFNVSLHVEYFLAPVIDRISKTLGISHFIHDSSKLHE